MTREELHNEIDRLVPDGNRKRSHVRMACHALIDLGRITEIRCQYSDCVLESRDFEVAQPNARGQRAALTLDHIVGIAFGGTDRPENLQLMHLSCNVSRTTKDAYMGPIVKANAREAMKQRWGNLEYRQRVSESMRQHWADPTQRAAHEAAMARGEDWHQAREEQEHAGDLGRN